MQKITMLRKGMLLMKVFLFLNLFFSFTQTNAQTLKTDAVVPVLDVCDQTKQFSVNIAKGSSACANGKLKIQLPDGFELQKGSVKVDNQSVVEDFRSGNEINVNLNVPAGSVSQEINVTFFAKALCNIIGNVSNVPVVTYTLEGCTNGTQVSTSDPINVRYAVLRISVTPTNYVGGLNDEVARTIKVVNQGNGDISSFSIERNLGNGLSHLSYDFTTLINQGWTIDYSNPNLILVSGKSLKSAESITFIENVKIESCSLTPTKYEVYYGCTDKCTIDNVNGTTTNVINLRAEGAPKLEVSSSNITLPCYNALGLNTWIVKNTGNVSTNQVLFEIATLDGIDISNNAITVNGTPVNVLPQSTEKNAFIYIPALPAGGSATIQFKQNYKAPAVNASQCESAPEYFATGYNAFSANFSYEGACAAVTNAGVVSEGAAYNYRGSYIGEIDIFGNEEFNVDYLFTNFNIPYQQLNVGDDFVITIELSHGLSTSGISFDGLNAVNVGDGKYEITFKYGSTKWEINKALSYSFARLNFPVIYDCSLAEPDSLWVKIGGELRKQQSNCAEVVFKCNTTKLKGFCENGSCENGLVNDRADLVRVSIGHQVNANGVPTTSVASNAAETRTFITGDILEINQVSKAVVSNGSLFNKVKFVVEKDPTSNATLVQGSGTIKINGSVVASGIDISEQNGNLIVLEHVLPFALSNDDQVILSLNVKVGSSSLGLKQFPAKSYLIDAQGNELICGRNYTATGLYVENSFETSGGTKDFVECLNENNAFVFSANILGFKRQDSFFPNEFRKLFVPTTATLNVPEHMLLTGVKVTVKNQTWLGNNDSFTISNLNVTNQNYVLNLSNAIKEITKQTLGDGVGIDYLDEGYELEITPIVSLSACEQTVKLATQDISVNFQGTVIDGKNPVTNFSEIKNLTYNTGFGSLTMKVSNDFSLGKFNEDATQVSWVVKIESEGSRNFNSVWISKNGGNLLIDSVSEVTNYAGENVTRVINPINGIYQLGNHGSREAKYYLIKSNVIDCNVESLILAGGYNCETDSYPNSIANAACRINNIELTHDKIVNIIQTEILDQFNGQESVKPDLCEDIWYTVQLHNGGDSKLKNLEISIPLNTAPGLSFDRFEFNDVYHTLDTPSNNYQNGTTYTVVDDVLNITLPNTVTLNTLERVRIKVYFKVSSCDFRSGSKHTVSTKAINTCDTEVLGNTKPSTKRIIIEGGSDFFAEVRTVENSTKIEIDPVLTTGTVLRAVYNAAFINSGEFDVNDAITNEYKVSLKLPENWSIVGNPADYITPSGKVNYSHFDETRGYIYNVISDVNVGETISFNNVPLKYTLANETQLDCNFNFGKIQLMVYQNIEVSACLPNPDCTNKGIDQVLYENEIDVELPLGSALSINTDSPIVEICNPALNGSFATLADINIDDRAKVFHLDWYENLAEATSDLAVNRLPINTPLVDGRSYYVVNKFIINGECKSNIAEIKVKFKQNSLSGIVSTICDVDTQSYKVQVVLTGTAPFVVTGTGAPGTFNGNTWTSNSITSSTPFNAGTNYSITFTDKNSCSPLVITGEAPVCCSLEISCPVEKIVNCGTSLEPSVTGFPTIVKSCGLTNMVYSDSEISNCSEGFKSFIRTFTVTDSKGNVKKCTQVIKIKDDVAPTFNGTLPANVTVSCSAQIPDPAVLTAIDNCGTATVSHSDEIIRENSNCDNNYVIKRTYVATDSCGNRRTHVQTITIKDTTAPTFNGTLPANVTVSCSAEIPAPVVLTATDNCGTATVSHSDEIIRSNNNCDNNYIVERTYVATDACGNKTTHVQTITIKDTTAPTFNGSLPANVTVSCTSEIPAPLALTATDNCGTSQVTHNDLLIFGNGNCDNNYVVERTYIATDACGNKTTHVQIITVKDTIAPVFEGTLPGDITVSCSSEIPTPRNLSATDNCGDATVTFSQVKVDGSCEGNFKWIRTWTATDSCGNKAVHTQTVNVEDKTAPTFTIEPISKIVECDGNGNLEEFNEWLNSYAGAVAQDNCSDVKLSYLVEDTNTTCGRSGNIVVTIFATDSCGNFDFKQAVFIIRDTTPPDFIEEAKSITVECGDNEDALNAWLATNGGAIAVDSCSSDVTWTNNFKEVSKACGNTGEAVVTFTAIDACGNKSTTTATFTIVDTKAPVLVTPAQSVTVSCDNNTTEALNNWLSTRGGAVVTEKCSEVTWSNNFVALTPGCGATGTTEVTFTATDDCGNFTITKATFTVEDKTAPVMVVQAKNKTVETDGNGNTQQLQDWLNANAEAIATDSCSVVTWTNNFTSLSQLCGTTGSADVTFTATDACGNSISTIATFTIVDKTAPTFATLPANKEVECDGNGNSNDLNEWIAANGNARVTDFSPEIKWSHSITEGTLVGKIKVYYVDFTATDDCGNASTKRAAFTIVDTQGPELITPSTNKEVECDGNGNTTALNAWLNSFAGATAKDVCGTVTWSHNFTGLTSTCGSAGFAEVIFKATDASGNSTTTTATFTIVDTKAPILISPAQSLTVSCATNTTQALNNWLATRGGATASDSCSGVIWTNNYVELTPGCGSTGNAEVTFTATDACGNSVSTVATFTIEDKVLPVIVKQAKNKTVESDGNGNTEQLEEWLNANAEAIATDTCSTVTWSNDFTSLTQSCGTTGSADVTFTASDACGNSVSTLATFTIVDTTPPEFIILVENETVECDGQGNEDEFNDWLSRKGNATIRENSNQVTWNYVINSTVTANATIHTVDFEVTDACGNKASKRGVFTILDTTAPEITVPASSKIVECDGNGNTTDLAAWLSTHGGAEAVDLCGTATWSHNFSGLTDGCGSTGSAEVTFTATDASGNTSISVATFTIVDTTAPTFESNLPQDLVLECSMEIPKAELINAVDLCGSATVTFEETTIEGSCAGNYDIVRTWIATDSCGNTTSHVQTITIQDTTAPEFVGTLPASEVFMNCKDFKDAEVLTAIDNCGAVTVTSYDERIEGDCEAKYDILRTWVATDTCGNETSYTQTIHLSCAITIYNAVTADGDGNNDEFIIEGINCYPGNTVEIFNRWGVLVYETKNYNSNGNTFKGFADGRATISKGSKLPTGTYFYVVKYTYDLGNGEMSPIEQAGYLHLETN